MTRKQKERTLHRAGFVSVSGWVSAATAASMQAQIEAEAETVAAALQDATPGKSGRPRKTTA